MKVAGPRAGTWQIHTFERRKCSQIINDDNCLLFHLLAVEARMKACNSGGIKKWSEPIFGHRLLQLPVIVTRHNNNFAGTGRLDSYTHFLSSLQQMYRRVISFPKQGTL
jgi:hypothetical protein